MSAKNVLSPCPPSLFKALYPSNIDHQVCLDSYNKDKRGLINHEIYENISNTQYLALKLSGNISKAIPSMCVLVVKNDKYGKPLHAKSCIVVLGNFKDRLYQKFQCYAPVLKYTSLRLLTAKVVGEKNDPPTRVL